MLFIFWMHYYSLSTKLICFATWIQFFIKPFSMFAVVILYYLLWEKFYLCFYERLRINYFMINLILFSKILFALNYYFTF